MPPAQASRGKWIGIALIAVALLALPFVLAPRWDRMGAHHQPRAALRACSSLGLNIVVGFAGLLDLGYIAFFAVGAYVYALLASPAVRPALAVVGDPADRRARWRASSASCSARRRCKLRGDYLAIVTLGFGEIIRIFLNNLSEPFNITNGPQGITHDRPAQGRRPATSPTPRASASSRCRGTIKYYYFLLAVLVRR